MKPIIWDGLFRFIQKKFFKDSKANQFEPKTISGETTLEKGVVFKNEINYSDKYPNSYLDIFYGDNSERTLPTFINLHGGGYFMGSRVFGDPLVNMEKLGAVILADFAEYGFNVLLPDYCLSPDYRYPDQIHQVNEFFRWLIEKGEEYKLDTENIILMGDSAGAVITAIYAAVVTNPVYAKELGIEPAIGPDRLKGVIIDGSPLLVDEMDWKTAAMYKSWIGKTKIKKSVESEQINVSNWVTGNYIPSFLTAGNDGCFPKDVKVLYDTLASKGAKTEIYLVDPETAKEPHGYLNAYKTDKYAGIAVNKIIEFAKKLTESNGEQ